MKKLALAVAIATISSAAVAESKDALFLSGPSAYVQYFESGVLEVGVNAAIGDRASVNIMADTGGWSEISGNYRLIDGGFSLDVLGGYEFGNYSGGGLEDFEDVTNDDSAILGLGAGTNLGGVAINAAAKQFFAMDNGENKTRLQGSIGYSFFDTVNVSYYHETNFQDDSTLDGDDALSNNWFTAGINTNSQFTPYVSLRVNETKDGDTDNVMLFGTTISF